MTAFLYGCAFGACAIISIIAWALRSHLQIDEAMK